MKKLVLSAIGAAALAPAVTLAATTTYSSGQDCAYTNVYARNDQGLVNPVDNDESAYCPASWSTSAANGQGNAAVSIDAATLVYTDTSSGSFECHVVAENWDGSIYSSYSLYSCRNYGGCGQDTDRGWQGGGQLDWSSPVVVNAPSLYPTSIAVRCRVPGSGSVVRGYNFSLN